MSAIYYMESSISFPTGHGIVTATGHEIVTAYKLN